MGSSTHLTMTPMQIAFLNHPDALVDTPKAAIDVGYSETMAHSSKMRAFRNDHLPQLTEKLRARLEKIGVTPEWVKNEVSILARTAPADFLEFVTDPQGNQYTVLKPREQIDDKQWRAAIKEIEFDTYIDATGAIRSRVCKMKFYDRQKALIDIATLMGMMSERVMEAQVNAQASIMSEEQRMLEAMEPEELESIARVHQAVRDRILNKDSTKRDRKAITQKVPTGSKDVE